MAKGPTCASIQESGGNFSEPCTQWNMTQPSGGSKFNCLSITQDKFFVADFCTVQKGKTDYICQFVPSTLTTNRNITLNLGDGSVSKIEFWLKRRIDSVSDSCDGTLNMPGFSIDWNTMNGNNTRQNEIFGVTDVLDKTDEWSKETYNKTISLYNDFMARWVRIFFITNKARKYNMSNTEIWNIASSVKKEAISNNLFECESNVMTIESFYSVFRLLHRSVVPKGEKLEYSETEADKFLSFDIFAFMTYCQNEAMELQIFFEKLLRTETPQTILQATVNTMKLDYQEKSTIAALQLIYNELSSIMDLKLPKILAEMINSDVTGLSSDSSNENMFMEKAQDTISIAEMNITNTMLSSEVSSHPFSIFNQQGLISPSAFIPFCSFGAEMIGTKVPNMTFRVCDIFEPTVYKGGLYDGRLCYQANVKKNPGQIFFEGKASGLMLLIDNNNERSIDISNSQKSTKALSEQNIYLGEDKSNTENMASIYIGTLAPYHSYGPGDYEMTGIKKIEGTENFLAWPHHRRGCTVEKYEKCQMREFLEKTVECGCSPFQFLPSAGNTSQVDSNSYLDLNFNSHSHLN